MRLAARERKSQEESSKNYNYKARDKKITPKSRSCIDKSSAVPTSEPISYQCSALVKQDDAITSR